MFAAVASKLNSIRMLSALANATGEGQPGRPDADAPPRRSSSHEPIVLARKPLAGTVAATVAAHGTGALHVAACRVEIPEGDGWSVPNPDTRIVRPACGAAPNDAPPTYRGETRSEPNDGGRWPTNALFSHAPECDDACADGCPVAALDAQAGPRASGGPGVVRATAGRRRGNTYGEFNPPEGQPLSVIGDSGPASRFFPTFRYVAKPARGEREAGLRRFEAKTTDDGRAKSIDNPYLRGETRRANVHPTVKPVDLMRWLCRLVTPPGGVVLDPLTGSGTTGVAALAEGFRFVGVEREAEYVAIARARIAAAPGHQLPLLAEGDR